MRRANDEPTLAGALRSGRTQGTAGVVLLGVGAAAFATAVIWFLARSEPAATVAVTPVQGGVVAGIGGRWLR